LPFQAHVFLRTGITCLIPPLSGQANFQKWNDALQTKDAKAVASMYSESDLSFLPTVSPKHISKLDSTQEYFEAFVMKDPFGTITDDSVQVYENGNAYLHSGLYTFDLGEGAARAPTEARFSYMWRKENGGWKIAHHHSSVRPASKGPTQADMLAVARVRPASHVCMHT
jgi:uncharacterized protein (TIGR02246 family)